MLSCNNNTFSEAKLHRDYSVFFVRIPQGMNNQVEKKESASMSSFVVESVANQTEL